eukprot:Phypoly_transcript_04680.p1 GENE.Phypoly_transcript_04680~~Phypoly_transcript_04680.p1  ORF type:complete len:557 (+),score=27.15 Phypoly_transcript_04680:61-1731(+)
MLLISVIFFVAITCIVVSAQTCEPFRGSPLTSHICDQFAGPYVYVPANSTQEALDVEVASQVRTAQALAPYYCAKAIIELLCQTAFLSCSPLLPLPSFPCKDKCNSVLQECEPYATDVGALALLNCNMKNNITMQDTWPNVSTIFNISGVISTPCNGESTNTSVLLAPTSCPFPYELDPSLSPDDPPCRLRCPLPILTPAEYEFDRKITKVIGSLSIVFIVFLMTSFLLAKRVYPFNLFLNLFVACLLVIIAVLIAVVGGNDFVCHNGVPSTEQNFPPCAFQGALLFYAALASTCWWFIIVLNLYLMVIETLKVKKSSLLKAQHIYYCFGWGFPLILLIIAVSASKFSFNAPNIVCFLPLFGMDVWYQYGLFYIPIGIFTVSGAVLILLILFQLFNSHRKVGGNVESRTRNKLIYYKIFFFGTAFLGIWASIFIGRLTVANNEPAEKSFNEWVLCHINAYAQNTSYEICGEVPPVRLSRSAMRVQYVAEVVHGILLFFLFGKDRELYSSWQLVFNWFYPGRRRPRKNSSGDTSDAPNARMRAFSISPAADAQINSG